MERLISSGFALVIIGIGCHTIYEYLVQDILSMAVNPFRSPIVGAAAIGMGAYVIYRDLIEWGF